mgnify:CR=1 FL=1
MQPGDKVRILSGIYAGQIGTVLSANMLRDLGGVTVETFHPAHGRLPQWHLVSQLRDSHEPNLTLSQELELILKRS